MKLFFWNSRSVKAAWISKPLHRISDAAGPIWLSLNALRPGNASVTIHFARYSVQCMSRTGIAFLLLKKNFLLIMKSSRFRNADFKLARHEDVSNYSNLQNGQLKVLIFRQLSKLGLRLGLMRLLLSVKDFEVKILPDVRKIFNFREFFSRIFCFGTKWLKLSPLTEVT